MPDAAGLTTITFGIDAGVARVGLNRPEVRNAINLTMVQELTALLGRLRSDPGVRALVITGEGSACFASGADIRELRDRTSAEALLALNAGLFQAVEDFPRPTVAAIRGFALGGGLELALACDLRVASRSAKLGLPEVTLGIYPAAGGTWRLPRLIGLGHAKELVYTGRIIEGDEAYALGMVEQVCVDTEVESTAMELAMLIAQNAPLAVRQPAAGTPPWRSVSGRGCSSTPPRSASE